MVELTGIASALRILPPLRYGGRVASCAGTTVHACGLTSVVGIGESCWIDRSATGPRRNSRPFHKTDAVLAEVVGFDAAGVRLLAYEELTGLGAGARVCIDRSVGTLRPDRTWLGRVVDALGRPVDGGAPLTQGPRAYPVQARAVAAHRRTLLGSRISTGVRALDLFTPCCAGQRMGIFAGSGVGKSSLLSMIARQSSAEVLVIGLIGERGRELNEFLTHTLGPEGLARSIVVVATSDQPAMMRRRAAYVTLTIAEYLRDQGLQVLCLLDSVTRFAMALREIFLAAGEPPTTKGYPPSVFAELPRLLERAGPGEAEGSITGLFTVLVEGDDLSEPVADTVRGILDGHIVLDRRIGETGRYPAVDVLKSLSRAAPGCYAADERPLVAKARELMAAYAEMAELIQLGAYKPGSNTKLDQAIAVRPALEELLRQGLDEPATAASPFARLAQVLAAGQPVRRSSNNGIAP